MSSFLSLRLIGLRSDFWGAGVLVLFLTKPPVSTPTWGHLEHYEHACSLVFWGCFRQGMRRTHESPKNVTNYDRHSPAPNPRSSTTTHPPPFVVATITSLEEAQKQNRIMNFEGKTVIITGAGGNFGRAGCLYFAERGANVAAFDVNMTSLEETATAVKERTPGAKICCHTCNVTDAKSVKAAVDEVVLEFGSIELLWNNAGYQGEIKAWYVKCQDLTTSIGNTDPIF
eukprot:scaffold22611_cov153-Cylindrotheca_fusiformis.AAC.3